MLQIECPANSPMCDGVSRRSFLQAGSLGLGGLTLAHLFAAKANAGAMTGGSYIKDKAVVFLFLGGGPSQHETWDPKPDGLGTSKSIAGHLATRLPGVRFATYFPKMAELADRLSIVRSFHTHHAEHSGAHKQIMTADITVPDGKPINHPGMGSVYSRVVGATHPRTGLPKQIVIPPTTDYLPEKAGFAGSYESVVEGCQPAYLGSAYKPFEFKVPMAEGVAKPTKSKSTKGATEDDPEESLLTDLQPRLPTLRLTERMSLLKQLDQLNRRLDSDGLMSEVDTHTARALEVLGGGAVRKALDLSLEDPRTLAAYDTEHLRNYRCDDNSKFLRNGPSIGSSLGRQLLMARRLCEAGCGFVNVINANWDFHARKGIPNIPEGMSVLAPPLDHAVAAFLEDVRQRGLEDKILLVITGEFGRTPSLDENLGRHHWPRLCPLVFAGGGLQHGRVIGDSDRRGGEPANDPYSIDDLHATVMHTLFDVGQLRLDSSLPKIVQERATKGRIIQEMF